MFKKNSGFTLIELLIVMGIIAILATIVLVALGPSRAKARDTRRIADMRDVQQLLELYHTQFGHYPPQNLVSGGGQVAWSDLQQALTDAGDIHNGQFPQDPLYSPTDPNSRTYMYGVSGDGQDYILAASLEDPNNPVLSSSVHGSEYGIDCQKNANWYCVTF